MAEARAVITGMGLVSALGHDLPAVERALRCGSSGIVRDARRRELGFRSTLTGAIAPFDPGDLLSRRERKPMGEPALYGAVAALRALEDAGLPRDGLAGPDRGVIVSNDSTCGAAVEVADRVRAEGGTAGLGSSHVIRVMASSVATTLSVLLGTRGALWDLGAGCAGGTHALGQAARLVARGEQRAVLVVGTQELSWITTAGFDALAAFSSHDGPPEEASRPFDEARDGLVPSGGGAALVIESLDDARARSAEPLAEVLGYGYSSDGGHITSPTGDGAVRGMGMGPGEVGVVPQGSE